MAINSIRKAACQAAIKDHLKGAGTREWSAVRDAFGDVSAASFWRWVRAAKAAALTDKMTALDARADALAGDGLRAAAATLPAVPSAGDLCSAVIDPQAILAACLKNANEVVDYARGANGRLRSPKLLLAASRAMAETLRTAAQVSAVLLDERQTRGFYRAIMTELGAESLELQARVAARLEAFNSDLGLRSYVGR